MSRGSKLTDEERIAALREYQDGKGSYRVIGGIWSIGLCHPYFSKSSKSRSLSNSKALQCGSHRALGVLQVDA